MSTEPATKEWVEQKITALDHKIEMQNVKTDGKFETTIAHIDIKSAELKSAIADIKTTISDAKDSQAKWLGATMIAIAGLSGIATFRAIPSYVNDGMKEPLSEIGKDFDKTDQRLQSIENKLVTLDSSIANINTSLVGIKENAKNIPAKNRK